MSPSALRSDARRNRERILAAASELFAEDGTAFCVDEIARRAGVGHATVFRRFPTKDDLILALVEDRILAAAEAIEAAASREDPWEALRGAMEELAERHASNRGLLEAVADELWDSPQLVEGKARLMAPFGELVARARAAGVIRDDLEALDLTSLVIGASHAARCRAADAPGLWRRYLGIVLDGIRPEAARA
jgi:AcrR family transcriptional regulator